MLSGASDPLKKRLGWIAYAISAVRHLGDRPVRVTVSADGGRRRRMRASALIVGNVGWLRGGLPLLPDARPDDGLLDAVVLIAGGPARWLAVAAAILLHRPAHGKIYRIKFTELQVSLDQEQPWELDGEVMGPGRQLTVVAQPGAPCCCGCRQSQPDVGGTNDACPPPRLSGPAVKVGPGRAPDDGCHREHDTDGADRSRGADVEPEPVADVGGGVTQVGLGHRKRSRGRGRCRACRGCRVRVP